MKIKNSIIRKIIKSMIIVLVTQASIFIIMFMTCGIIDNLKENAFNTLNDKVKEKNIYLQNKMLQSWNNIGEYEEKINNYILDELSEKDLTTDDLNNSHELSAEVLNNVSADIISMLRNKGATGAFIVFDSNEEKFEEDGAVYKEGFYIRDLDPTSNSSDNSDLLIQRGPASIAENFKIPMISDWKSKCVFYENEPASNHYFFYKPIEAAIENKEIDHKKLGYWGKPSILTDDNLKVITYSVPLINYDGHPYGVLGIDIDVEYINKILKEDRINKVDSYAIVVSEGDEMIFDNITAVGEIGRELIKASKNLEFNIDKIYYDTYKIKENEYLNDTIYGCIKYFNLYGSNVPYEDEKWAIVGLIEKNNLFYYINEIMTIVILSLTISTLISIIVAYMTGKSFTRPIITLVKKVNESDPKKPCVLEKINVSEIDELSSAITNLSINVADSASKLVQVIELFNMPIGAFESKKDEGKVYYTNGFFDILGIEDTHLKNGCLESEVFKQTMNKILVLKEENTNDIFKITNNINKTKWIRINIKEDETKSYGVITDVTQEVLERRKIAYERDHDILTGLLSRLAFRDIVSNKICYEEAGLYNAAFVICDLDNLKYINDIYGHECGDKYIKEAGEILKEFEEFNSVVCRRSGDEFVIFIYGYKNKEDIRNIIIDIHNKMKNTSVTFSEDKNLKIRSSMGVAWYPEDADNYNELIRYSDFALYKVKHQVKGEINEFNKKEYDEESFLLHDKEELNKLIDGQLIEYAFQPIVDAHTGKIFAYEALMRSKLPTIRSPFHIISLATAESKLYEIERLTWFKSFEAFAKNEKEFGDAKLFINSIPNYVLSEKDAKEMEDRYLKYFPRLVVEFLENERSTSESTAKKKKLIEMWNAQLAIDDFGSGYNNEATLLDITPDFVKIDMEIIRGIDKDLNRQQICKNLISYAKGRNIKIIAEGVETKEELEKTIELGVDYIQGYYFCTPEFIPPKINKDLITEVLNINKKYFK